MIHQTSTRKATAAAAGPTAQAILWLAAATVGLVVDAHAQEVIAQSEWKAGYNGFAVLCQVSGLTAHADVASWSASDPRRRVLIVLGDADNLPVDPVELVGQGGAALIASDQPAVRTFAAWGVGFNRGPRIARSSDDMYRRRNDCPLVTWLEDHPTLQRCRELATNRPGHLSFYSAPPGTRLDIKPIARLPLVADRLLNSRRHRTGPVFLVAVESRESGGRALLLADQTMFCNQMLTCGDNKHLALNTLRWLQEEGRTELLIVSDRQIALPLDPRQLEVQLPPPSPREVREALRQLPPEALLEFGNLVAAAAEDEGVINELLAFVFEELPERPYMRALILSASLVIGLLLLWAFWRRRTDTRELDGGGRGTREALERRQAALTLLDQLRGDVTGDISAPWEHVLPVMLRRLQQAGAPSALGRELSRTVKSLRRRPDRPWRRRDLERLEEHVTSWRQALAAAPSPTPLTAADLISPDSTPTAAAT